VAPITLAVEEVPSSAYLSVIWKFLTESLCEAVFASTRIAERRRKWTLFAMTWFWIALLQSRYTSQTRALLEVMRGALPLFPKINATPEAFFQKVKNTRPEFFRNLFRSFTDSLESVATACFETQLSISATLFPHIYALDGSRLAKVARMLKVARDTTKAIIPGSMEALYDLRRGILQDLYFDPDGCVGEIRMLVQILDRTVKGALILADRYYAKPAIWRLLEERGLFMVTRYNRTVMKRRVAVIETFRSKKLSFDDYLVDMGAKKPGTTPVRLRAVRIWGPGFIYTILTNVIDPKKLSPEKLLELYRRRWSVERMYLAMKEILNLNHLYNCSPAAVGQQVYATAILYNALRVSQGQIANVADIAPEQLSPDKLFPTLIEQYVKATELVAATQFSAGKALLGPPDLSEANLQLAAFPWLRIRIRDYLLEKRSERRRKRRYCKGRRQATSYNHVRGGKKLMLS
jgi:Transposase DDE domain